MTVLPESFDPNDAVTGQVFSSTQPIALSGVVGARITHFASVSADPDTPLLDCVATVPDDSRYDARFFIYGQTTSPDLPIVGDYDVPFPIASGPGAVGQFIFMEYETFEAFGPEAIELRIECSNGEYQENVLDLTGFTITSTNEPTPVVSAASAPSASNSLVLNPNGTPFQFIGTAQNIGATGDVLVKISSRLSDEIPRPEQPVTIRLCEYTSGEAPCSFSSTSQVLIEDFAGEDDPATPTVFENVKVLRIEGRLNPGACISNNAIENRMFMVITDPTEQLIYGASSFDVRSVPGLCPQ